MPSYRPNNLDEIVNKCRLATIILSGNNLDFIERPYSSGLSTTERAVAGAAKPNKWIRGERVDW